jgi:hypothetical protein
LGIQNAVGDLILENIDWAENPLVKKSEIADKKRETARVVLNRFIAVTPARYRQSCRATDT